MFYIEKMLHIDFTLYKKHNVYILFCINFVPYVYKSSFV
jgi:hypothetical protein